MRVLELGPAASLARWPDVDPQRLIAGLEIEGKGASVVLIREPFDSEIFEMAIGRIARAEAPSSEAYRSLYDAVAAFASRHGLEQVLRRVPVSDLAEVWALEGAGFELMDVGVTFAKDLAGPTEARPYDDLVVRPATDADMAAIVPPMVERPWGSRYESDPAYPPDRVVQLRTRWLWNSHRGRAQAVLVGVIEGKPAGYVTCLLHAGSRVGEIDLVGTLPGFRGRHVASRILEHAVAWFSSRADRVTVRTQATNFAAASLYEKAGFTLCMSDMTFRLPTQGRSTRVP